MATKLIAVVTGSNRGIGRAIVEKLASTSNKSQLIIYATSRSGKVLDIAVQHGNEVHYDQLDITDPSSISDFLQRNIKQGIAVDILINNAGVNVDYDNDGQNLASKASKTVKINYEATKNMCLAFLESKGGGMSVNKGSRIVNVSSAAASLHGYSKTLQDQFRQAKSIADVDALAKDYLDAISVSKLEAENRGWNKQSYSVSKALINAMTVVIAKCPEGRDVLINACDPGWVASDMGSLVGNPPKTEEEGARIPVRLAIGNLDGVSGKFWGNHDVSDTADGLVLFW